LHVTASAVSHAVAKLESRLGRDLVEWKNRKLSLTPEGARLFQVCQRVFDDLEQVDRELGQESAATMHHFVLGSTVEFGTTVLVPRLRPLLQAHPNLSVRFHFSHDLLTPLLRDEIDLAMDCKHHAHPLVHREPVFREKYVVVAAPAFLAAHPVKSPLDLRRTPVVSLDGEAVWWNNLTHSLPAERRPLFERVITVDNVRGMINAAIAGYGVALLPKYSVLGELAAGTVVALFPRLRLLEDTFSVYQKVARVERYANRLVTKALLGLEIRDFGDAIGAHT
jgi:DNA-binding transcriptional LysR family regulator